MLALLFLLAVQQPLNEKDTKLLDTPKGWTFLEISPDGRKAVCWAPSTTGGRTVLVYAEGNTEEYDDAGRVAFGPKGQRMGYVGGKGPANEKEYAVVDGKPTGPVGGINKIHFSPNGQDWAFVGYCREDKKESVFLNGKKLDEFPDGRTDVSRPFFSADGKLVYRKVRLEAGKERHQVIVGGEKASAEYDSIGIMNMHSRGERLAFEARRGDRMFMVLDGVELPPYDLVFGFSFSPDGRRYAYMGSSDEHSVAVIDGTPVGEKGHFVDGFTFSPNSKRLAYVFETLDEGKHVVLDGKKGRRFLNAYGLSFSPDSKRLAYGVQDELGRRVVIDGRVGPAFEWWTEKVLFTPDSRRAVYLARCTSSAKVGLLAPEINGEIQPDPLPERLCSLSVAAQEYAP